MRNGIKWNIQGRFNVDLNLGTIRKNPTLINSCPMPISNPTLDGLGTKMIKNLQFYNPTIMEVKPQSSYFSTCVAHLTNNQPQF
jgi:hypothetical protein